MGHVRLSYDRRNGGFVEFMHWRGAALHTHRHAELELNLVLKGRGTYILDDRRYELARDSLLWLFPAQDHVLTTATDDFSMIVAVFGGRLVRQYATGRARPLAARKPRESFCRRISADQARRIRDLSADVRSIESDAQRVGAGLSYLMLQSWDAYLSASDIMAHGTLHPSVEQAARLLGDTMTDARLPDVAAAVGLSPSRLSRLFAQQMGVTFAEFRNTRRLERFMEHHAANPEANILATALDAGFGSYAQFYRVFRKAFGYGPAELRAH